MKRVIAISVFSFVCFGIKAQSDTSKIIIGDFDSSFGTVFKLSENYSTYMQFNNSDSGVSVKINFTDNSIEIEGDTIKLIKTLLIYAKESADNWVEDIKNYYTPNYLIGRPDLVPEPKKKKAQ